MVSTVVPVPSRLNPKPAPLITPLIVAIEFTPLILPPIVVLAFRTTLPAQLPISRRSWPSASPVVPPLRKTVLPYVCTLSAMSVPPLSTLITALDPIWLPDAVWNRTRPPPVPILRVPVNPERLPLKPSELLVVPSVLALIVPAPAMFVA